jgi:pimeloyl-ACP methyl ester carboxylesterase
VNGAALLLCHGWGGIKAHLDLRYAPKFVRAGFRVLTFDYRGWGGSDGVLVPAAAGADAAVQDAAREAYFERGDASSTTSTTRASIDGHVLVRAVRNTIDMNWQRADIAAAFQYLRSLAPSDGVDPSRCGIWGSSQGGGHALGFSASDADCVAACVAQVPSCGKFGAGDVRQRTEEGWAAAAAAARAVSPAASIPQGVRGRHFAGMDGVPITRRLCVYDPLATAGQVTAPVLIIDAEGEEIFDRAENGRRAFEMIRDAQRGGGAGGGCGGGSGVGSCGGGGGGGGGGNCDSCKSVGSSSESGGNESRVEYALVPGRHYDVYDAQNRRCAQLAVAFFTKHLRAKGGCEAGLGGSTGGEGGKGGRGGGRSRL